MGIETRKALQATDPGQGNDPLPLIASAALIATPFLHAVISPLLDASAGFVPAGIAALALVSLVRRPAWLRRLDARVQASSGATHGLIAGLATIVTLGGIELAATGLVQVGLIEPYAAMRTLVPADTDDWRLAHITVDHFREPDPVLLWRPVASGPYNAQRMKGPLATIPKPPGRIRIMAYGDSNTDGPDDGGWAAQLSSALAAYTDIEIEVLNAGVAGYSSHQGLRRFEQEVALFEPDIVLVAFGWNDVATPSGPPDNAYVPPSAWRLALTRVALRYDAFLVLRRVLLHRKTPGPVSSAHRVSLDDYVSNLDAFVELARRHGALPVLLTRPHRQPRATRYAEKQKLHRFVPRYNRAVLALAEAKGVLAVDAQAAFASSDSDFVDACHFSPPGHTKMAALVAESLYVGGAIGRAN